MKRVNNPAASIGGTIDYQPLGRQPLSRFAWCRHNQVAKDAARLDARVSFRDGAKGGDVGVRRRSLDAIPRIGLVDATGVQQHLFGHSRQRHIRRMPAAQSFHQVDTAVHVTTRGQDLRSPLLVMPVRPSIVEAASVEQRAIAERAGLGVSIGAASAVWQDVPEHRKQLVRPMGCKSRVGTQGTQCSPSDSM